MACNFCSIYADCHLFNSLKLNLLLLKIGVVVIINCQYEVMNKFGPTVGREVAKEIKEYKKGRWKSPEQAVAIGLSKARKMGKKVPKEGAEDA